MKKPEEDQYDEFGNYIGPASEEDGAGSLDLDSVDENFAEPPLLQEPETRLIERAPLHEEKQYYPELALAYPHAETLVQEEDVQDLEEPIIQPPKANTFYQKFDVRINERIREFTYRLSQNPRDVRNVLILGPLGSGKSKFCDLLFGRQELLSFIAPTKKFTNDTVFERARKLTVSLKPFSLPLPDRGGKHYLFNFLDSPGHPDFFDELKCGLEVVDGVVLVVDVIEGVSQHCRRILDELGQAGLPVTLVLNKLDRFVTELKLPPEDAYLKLRLLLDELSEKVAVSPTKSNVWFCSTRYRFLFELDFFAQKSLASLAKSGVLLSKLLWGNLYFDAEAKEFVRQPRAGASRRTFVEFVLDPIYKIFSHVVAKEKEPLREFLAKLGMVVNNKVSEEISLKEMLRLVFGEFMCDVAGFVQQLARDTPTADQGNLRIMARLGGNKAQLAELGPDEGRSEGRLLVLLTKVYPEMPALDDPPATFSAFGRVLSGRLTAAIRLALHGSHSATQHPPLGRTRIQMPHCGYLKFDVREAFSGSLVYLEGIGRLVDKQAWAVDAQAPGPLPNLRLRELAMGAKMKVAVEPLKPSQLPVLLDALSNLARVFPGLKTKTEESGELVILGRGELFLDTVLYFLRDFYAKCEVRVSEPACVFAEGGSVTSQIFGHARSENRKNSLKFLVEPLEKEITGRYNLLKNLEFDELERALHGGLGDADLLTFEEPGPLGLRDYLTGQLGWDRLSAKSLWSFGPSREHSCLLLDDSLPSETDPVLLAAARPHIVSGFLWAAREGPLCEEPLHNTKVKLTSALLAELPAFRSAEQLTAITRKAIHTALLLAGPRIFEPLYDFEVCCTQDALQTVYTILSRRRGQLLHERPKPGTGFYDVVGRIPVLESFGFEVDIKAQSLGQAAVSLGFGGWEMMPGDPLDRTAKLTLLEPVEPLALARDVMIKTRRRKGLSDDISIVKYFDDENMLNAIKNSFLV